VEAVLHPWTSNVVVPVFALANAGVVLTGGALAQAAISPVTLGVMVGLVVGKPLGITLASAAAVRFGLGRLPAGVSWRHVLAVGVVAGIGFTVSIFVSELAFTDPGRIDQARIGVLFASVTAGVLGWVMLWLVPAARRRV
jgi:Na+/H+ antiporter NhaA